MPILMVVLATPGCIIAAFRRFRLPVLIVGDIGGAGDAGGDSGGDGGSSAPSVPVESNDLADASACVTFVLSLPGETGSASSVGDVDRLMAAKASAYTFVCKARDSL